MTAMSEEVKEYKRNYQMVVQVKWDFSKNGGCWLLVYELTTTSTANQNDKVLIFFLRLTLECMIHGTVTIVCWRR